VTHYYINKQVRTCSRFVSQENDWKGEKQKAAIIIIIIIIIILSFTNIPIVLYVLVL
jgi:hypothetical protein